MNKKVVKNMNILSIILEYTSKDAYNTNLFKRIIELNKLDKENYTFLKYSSIIYNNIENIYKVWNEKMIV